MSGVNDQPRGCVGKKRYLNRKEARKAKKWMKIHKGWIGLEDYRCEVCGSWHIGRSRRVGAEGK